MQALIIPVTCIIVEQFYGCSDTPQITRKGLMWLVARASDFNSLTAVIRYIEN
jgi:hypothetical protein